MSVSEPGPGAGAELLAEREAAAAPEPTERGEPPLGAARGPPRPDRRSLLLGALRIRELRLPLLRRARARDRRARWRLGRRRDDEPRGPEVRRRFGPGVAVHALLEWSARNRWREPDAERVAARPARAGTGGEPSEAGSRRSRWFGAFLGSRAARARSATPRSAPRSRSCSRSAGRWSAARSTCSSSAPTARSLVVDYKTDRLEGRDPAEIARRYSVQRDLYALAAAARGTPVETAYVFLERPDPPVREASATPSSRRRASGSRRCSSGSPRADFEVTDRPHRALCLDCPARERLCSHGPRRRCARPANRPSNPARGEMTADRHG